MEIAIATKSFCWAPKEQKKKKDLKYTISPEAILNFQGCNKSFTPSIYHWPLMKIFDSFWIIKIIKKKYFKPPPQVEN